MHVKNKASGFTLPEVLIALAVNVVILLGLVTVFSSNVSHSTKTTNIDALSQQLETAMQLMANDIRRAGYWGNAISDLGTGVNNNPFMAAGTDVNITGGNCILFTYDYDSNNSLATVSSTSDDERYGFRLNGQTLQTRPPGASFDCSAAANAWENVTDPGIVQVTALSFTLNSTTVPVGATSASLLLRSVDISITGRLTSDNTITKTLTQHVRIMNDKYVP
jgi:type IV pilus assembly protein PilW